MHWHDNQHLKQIGTKKNQHRIIVLIDTSSTMVNEIAQNNDRYKNRWNLQSYQKAKLDRCPEFAG